MRSDIQALRALAVLAVFAYHVRPDQLSGGFVGVDIFFVLSGFLITTHLLKELLATGKVSLSSFWARRAKRLLPASMTVLATTLIALLFLAPQALQERFLRDISAASLYVANWVFASESVEYLAADNSPSVVQHFWSLGVEEQLYFAWPILLAVSWMLLRGKGMTLGTVAASIGLVTLLSFLHSVALVLDSNPVAYFSTFSRVWEFGAGALLALLMVTRGGTPLLGHLSGNLASWVGWISLVGFMFVFEASSGFPGFNALIPVLATLLIILARDPDGRFSLKRWLNWRPIQFVGDASYSIYLWHWPILTLLGFYSLELDLVSILLLFIVVLAFSALSLRFIENPFRFGSPLSKIKPATTLFGGALSVVIVLSSSTLASGYVAQDLAAKDSAAAELQSRLNDFVESSRFQESDEGPETPAEVTWDELTCMGPASLRQNECAEFSWRSYTPAIGARETTANDIEPLVRIGSEKGCFAWGNDYSLIECIFGELGGKKTALVGDSHAYQWLPAFEQVAKRQGLQLHLIARAGCPGNLVDRLAAGDHVRGCTQWFTEFNSWLAENQDLELVIIANYSGSAFQVPGAVRVRQPSVVEGYQLFWQPLLETGAELVILKDNPYIGQEVWNCIVNNPEKGQDCSITREAHEQMVDNSEVAGRESGLRVVDMTNYFCTAEACPTVVGGIRVYRDTNHISGTYSLLLSNYLDKELFG